MKGKIQIYKIMKEYIQDARIFGMTPIFQIDVTLQILLDCEKANIRVLGIDGFEIKNGTRRPVQEESVDLSQEKRNSAVAAIDFLRKRVPSACYYELVLEDEEILFSA
jgi:hypothetical protein